MAEIAQALALIGRRVGAAAIIAAMAWVPTSGAAGRTAGAVVHLTIHHSHFSPPLLEVPVGPVTFVVHNTDPIGHELIIGDQATQDRHEAGTDAHHDGPGEITIAAGSTARTTYVFAPSTALLFGCHLPGHWAYGMHGLIRVEPARGG